MAGKILVVSMVYRLEVENFFSIRDRQVLDLTIAPNVPDPDNRYRAIFPGSDQRAPKIVALFGANASGKSNVLRALEFIIQFTRHSHTQVAGFPCERFNDEESKTRPISLAIEMGGVMNLSPETLERVSTGGTVEYGTYRYELVIALKDGVADHVELEALRQRPASTGKWKRVFERDTSGRVKDSRSFSLSGYQHLQNTLLPHVSVLASFAMFQHPIAKLFVDEAAQVLMSVGQNINIADQNLVTYLSNQPSIVSQLNRELGRIDVGVESMTFQDTPNGPQPLFKHSGLDVEMPWILESHGTRTFIKIFPILATILEKGSLAAIDEIDAAIHPLVLPEIVRWFYDPERNPADAQLWFSCHAASLLDELNKEEIVFCEKDRAGRTQVYSLMDVKAARRTDNFYKKYLSGVYGAVPQFG